MVYRLRATSGIRPCRLETKGGIRRPGISDDWTTNDLHLTFYLCRRDTNSRRLSGHDQNQFVENNSKEIVFTLAGSITTPAPTTD